MSSLIDRLDKANGLTDEDFKPQSPVIEVAEDAYLTAQYNTILIEQLMEE